MKRTITCWTTALSPASWRDLAKKSAGAILLGARSAIAATLLLTSCTDLPETRVTQSKVAPTTFQSDNIAQASDLKTFVNTRNNLDGKLAEHYVDFSFQYPSGWVLDPQAGKPGAVNFVKLERNLDDKSGKYTQENFAVGWYSSTGTLSGDRPLFPQLVSQLSGQFSKGFPKYEKVSEGETQVGAYKGYEFRFKSLAEGTPKGNVNFWGRVIFLPSGSPTQTNGVAMILLSTSLAPEINGIEDVGIKGQITTILNSFKLAAK